MLLIQRRTLGWKYKNAIKAPEYLRYRFFFYFWYVHPTSSYFKNRISVLKFYFHRYTENHFYIIHFYFNCKNTCETLSLLTSKSFFAIFFHNPVVTGKVEQPFFIKLDCIVLRWNFVSIESTSKANASVDKDSDELSSSKSTDFVDGRYVFLSCLLEHFFKLS